ncbi:MAG: hypothetical protein M1837_006193 [Sclerophora amabilis]|nr:MAG: hypothetical protein M1837_006193 [Sclerophora amabilis]
MELRSGTKAKGTNAGRTTRSGRPATAEDLIDWATEHSVLQGKAGLSETSSMEHFSSMFSMAAFPEEQSEAAPFANSLDLSSILGRCIGDSEREKWLEKVMKQNKGLSGQVYILLKGRLEALGVPREESEGHSIMSNIVRLVEARNPHVVDRQTFKIYLMVAGDPWGDTKEKLRLNFPWDVHFGHFQAVLKDLSLKVAGSARGTSRAEDQNGNRESSVGHGPWIYRLLDQKMQLTAEAQQVELKDVDGFKTLLRALRKKESPSAVIWHVRAPLILNPRPLRFLISDKPVCKPTQIKTLHLLKQSQDAKKQLSSEKAASGCGRHDPLDERGDPFFDDEGGKQDIDWLGLSRIGIGGNDVLARPVEPDLASRRLSLRRRRTPT